MPQFKIFALGSNGSGQLGIGSFEDTVKPERCIFDEEDLRLLPGADSVVKIVAGGNHTLVLLNSGSVFATGGNEDGQSALPQRISRTGKLHRVVLERGDGSVVEKFSDICATWSASFLIENGEIIHVLGSGSRGELGLGEGITKTGPRATIDLQPSRKITSIAGCMNHITIVSADGTFIGWGASRKGQLGQNGAKQKSRWQPTVISMPFQTSRVATGRDFTFCCDGKGSGALLGGASCLENCAILGQLDYVDAGWSHIYNLSEGRVTAIGRGERGQLPPNDLPVMQMISAGSEHCLGLTASGEVVVWGWGEHGNCGKPTDAFGNVAGTWNRIPVPLESNEIVTLITGGCATSFIVVDTRG